MDFANILLLLSIISNITAYIIYLYSMFRGKIKPHAFTFLVWAIILGINFLAQVTSGLGISSLLLASNLLGCSIVFGYCVWKGYTQYDRADWTALGFAILAIILWLVTKTPIYSVILSCVIDFFAFLPSFRKSFRRPHEDSSLAFFISGLEYLFSFPSYNVYSLIVLAYPVAVLTLDFTYAAVITVRRWQLKAPEQSPS